MLSKTSAFWTKATTNSNKIAEFWKFVPLRALNKNAGSQFKSYFSVVYLKKDPYIQNRTLTYQVGTITFYQRCQIYRLVPFFLQEKDNALKRSHWDKQWSWTCEEWCALLRYYIVIDSCSMWVGTADTLHCICSIC